MAHDSSSLSDQNLRKILGTRDPRLTEREKFIDEKFSDGETLRRSRSSEQFQQTLSAVSQMAKRNKILLKRSKSQLQELLHSKDAAYGSLEVVLTATIGLLQKKKNIKK